MRMCTVHSHQPDPTVSAARLVELADGVYAWVQPDGSWWVNNAGGVAGDDGSFVIDTCATEVRTRRFLDALRAATDDAPIRCAANTHEHGDHTYGNCFLPAETALIGHENMRNGLLADPVIDGCPPAWDPIPEWGAVFRRVPNIVTRSDLTVFSGTRRIDLLHPGYDAHTTGDLIAWLPAERVLYSGDLIFSGLTPMVCAGSVEGALRVLDWLADFEPEYLVPGHGAIVAEADLPTVLGAHERYYRFIIELAEEGRREGLDPLQLAQTADLGEYGTWSDSERLVLNLHRAYADAGGYELDMIQAFTDAVTFNGGAMITHVCCMS